jgi:hypothetical protein
MTLQQSSIASQLADYINRDAPMPTLNEKEDEDYTIDTVDGTQHEHQ